MTHKHDFKIILKEITPDGRYQITKECDCGQQEVEVNLTGMWRVI